MKKEFLEELLEFAKINVATNGKNMLYMINIPLVQKEACVSVIIKSVKKDKVISDTKYENIMICNNTIDEHIEECETHSDKTIFNRNNIVNLSNDSCITPLMQIENHTVSPSTVNTFQTTKKF